MNDLSRAWIATSDEVRAAIDRVMRAGLYVQGPEHAAFEAELAAYLGTRHAAGVASGTDALALCLQATGCTGREIVTAANAGGYTSVAAHQVGASVVYADVDPLTLLMTAETVERAIGASTYAVVVTHLFGNVADVDAIAQICRSRRILVIEDAAQAIGGTLRGRRVGSLCDAAALSFYPTKNLGGAGDGGAVVTDDPRVDALVRSLRQYGWGSRYQIVEASGRNSRLDEFQAAILRVGLRHVDRLNERRRDIVRRYQAATTGTGVRMVTGAGCGTVAHLAVARGEDRDTLRGRLQACHVQTDVHYPVPDHLQPGLIPPSRITDLRETECAAGEIFTLPCFPEMTEQEVGAVCAALVDLGE